MPQLTQPDIERISSWIRSGSSAVLMLKQPGMPEAFLVRVPVDSRFTGLYTMSVMHQVGDKTKCRFSGLWDRENETFCLCSGRLEGLGGRPRNVREELLTAVRDAFLDECGEADADWFRDRRRLGAVREAAIRYGDPETWAETIPEAVADKALKAARFFDYLAYVKDPWTYLRTAARTLIEQPAGRTVTYRELAQVRRSIPKDDLRAAEIYRLLAPGAAQDLTVLCEDGDGAPIRVIIPVKNAMSQLAGLGWIQTGAGNILPGRIRDVLWESGTSIFAAAGRTDGES